MRKVMLSVTALVVGAALAVVDASPAVAYYDGRYVFGGVADYDGDGHPDIVAKTYGSGLLYLFPGEGGRGPISPAGVQIGNGWNDRWGVVGVADWDADGHQDLLARDPDANIWLYPGQSVRGYSTEQREQIGNGWSGYDVKGVADWDNDGSQDIIARSQAGELWLYPGQSVRGYSYAPRVKIGNGWSSDWYFAGVADYDGDGRQDVVAAYRPAGELYLCPGNGRRALMTDTCVKIGNGWYGWGFAGIADWDGDGHADIVARAPQSGPYTSSPRDLWLYPGQSVRGYSTEPRALLGTDW